MEFRRLKTIDGNGSTLRYYPLGSGEEAEVGSFYEVVDGKAIKIDVGSEPTEGKIIGYCHGGDNLIKGMIMLEISAETEYMAILSTSDLDRPKAGDVVDGFKLVIDTHYTEEPKAVPDFGVETLDVPYYIFVIGGGGVGSAVAGESSRQLTLTIKNIANSNATVTAVPVSGNTETEVLGENETYDLAKTIEEGTAISTAYSSITIAYANGDTHTVDTTTVLSENTMYAYTTFTIPTYTITFDSNGGSDVPSQTVELGETVTEPTAPTKDNANFVGWFSDEELTTEYNFADAVAGPMTLYAKWEPNI